MEVNEVILKVVETVVIVAAFLIGRYVLPRAKSTIMQHATEFSVILNYAECFVAYARQFFPSYTGEEKMITVVAKLKQICNERGIVVDDETLRAIAQKAYEAMKAGEVSSKVIIETAVNELKDADSVLEPIAYSNAEQIITE